VSAVIASTATFGTSTSSVHGSSAKDRNEYTGRWRVVHNYVSADGCRDNALDHGDDRGGHDIINDRRGVDGLGITARLPEGAGSLDGRIGRTSLRLVGRLLRDLCPVWAGWWHRIGMETLSRGEVFARYGVELTRFAASLVGPIEAQDAVSEAMVRILWSKAWDRVDNQRAYLYQAVLSQAKMHHRAVSRRRIRETEAARVMAGSSPAPDIDVWDALGRLSLQERAVVFLTYWEDLKEADVATRLGVSDRTVRRRLEKARSTLGRVLNV
jgi:RNA polymerase sigma factor (sigma-70 family)